MVVFIDKSGKTVVNGARTTTTVVPIMALYMLPHPITRVPTTRTTTTTVLTSYPDPPIHSPNRLARLLLVTTQWGKYPFYCFTKMVVSHC